HAPIAALDIQPVEPPLQVHAPVSGRRVHAPIQVPPRNRAIPGAQPYISLGALHRDAPVARMDIQIAIDRFRLHRPIARIHCQVSVLRHVHFHPQAGVHCPPMDAPSRAGLRHHFHRIPALRRAHHQILIQLVPRINHAHFHLFNVARRDAHAAIVSFHFHARMSAHRKRLRHFLGPHSRRASQHQCPCQEGKGTPPPTLHSHTHYLPWFVHTHVTHHSPQMFPGSWVFFSLVLGAPGSIFYLGLGFPLQCGPPSICKLGLLRSNPRTSLVSLCLGLGFFFPL